MGLFDSIVGPLFGGQQQHSSQTPAQQGSGAAASQPPASAVSPSAPTPPPVPGTAQAALQALLGQGQPPTAGSPAPPPGTQGAPQAAPQTTPQTATPARPNNSAQPNQGGDMVSNPYGMLQAIINAGKAPGANGAPRWQNLMQSLLGGTPPGQRQAASAATASAAAANNARMGAMDQQIARNNGTGAANKKIAPAEDEEDYD